jgi:hypothetical protein
MDRNKIYKKLLTGSLYPCAVQVFTANDQIFSYTINSHGIIKYMMYNYMFYLPSDPLADVNFWVNGGWEQPKCGITGNPSLVPALINITSVDGKYCIA